MKNLNQNNSSTVQSTNEVRKSQKHDANLQKNSTLYFQVGLILCLLGTFALFEMQFKNQDFVIYEPERDSDQIEVAMVEVKAYVEVKEAPELPKSQIIIDKINIIDNDDPNEILKGIVTEPTSVSKPTAIGDIIEPTPIEEDIPMVFVEFAPIYPGCEQYNTNTKRKKCLNDKLTKLVQRKFNTDIAQEHGLTGVQKINVQFKVDKQGNIIEIKTRAPHPKLEEEAERTINKIPKMEPGKMGDRPVNVIYTLPIKFKVEN